MNDVHTLAQAPRALVVGAGIAGLTAAAVLGDRGWDVEVVESADSLRRGGYKIDVRGSAVDVLDRLGLREAAESRRCEVRAGSVVTAEGKVVAAMGGDTFGGRSGDDIEIERGDLLDLLAARAGEVRYGVTITGLFEGPTSVGVTFADGAQCSYDVVLGCDGLRSAVRRLAGLEPVDRPALRTLGYAIAVCELADDAGLDREEVTFVAPGATALAYSTATSGGARALLLFRHDGDVPADRAGQARLLRRMYPSTWRVPEMIDAFAAADHPYIHAMSQVVIPRWHTRRVVLLGDAATAASPASGQGTTLALLTAYTAAATVGRGGFDKVAELDRLRDLAARNQQLGRRNITRMVLPGRFAVASTLLALRTLRLFRMQDAVLGQVVRALQRASRFDLPPPAQHAKCHDDVADGEGVAGRAADLG